MKSFTISCLSLLNWNEAGRPGVVVWDWPSRLSGEGSIPTVVLFPRLRKASRGGWSQPFISPSMVTRLPLCSVMREAQREGEKKGNAGYSSIALTFFIYCSNGMWMLHGLSLAQVLMYYTLCFIAEGGQRVNVFSSHKSSNQNTDSRYTVDCWVID